MKRIVIACLAASVALGFGCGSSDGDGGGGSGGIGGTGGTGGSGGTGGVGGTGGTGGDGGSGGTGGDGGSGGTGGDGGSGGTGGDGGTVTPTFAEACTAAHACDPELENRTELLGADAAACAALDPNPAFAACLVGASDCEEMAECTRCLTAADSGYCTDACATAVDCGELTDQGQCQINCSMYAGGFGSTCTLGFDRGCWEAAAGAEGCGWAENCRDFGGQ